MQNYFYSSIAGIALIVHLIINWRQLVNWRNAKLRTAGFEFRVFIVSLLFFFATDVMWGIISELKRPRLLYADTVLFFLTMAFSCLAWARCVFTYLQLSRLPRNCLLWSGRILLALFVAALVINGFTENFFFNISPQGEYTAGPVRKLALILLIAFNALGSIVTLFKLLHADKLHRQRNQMEIGRASCRERVLPTV